MKIRPVGAELFHADRQTDRNDEAIVAFRNSAIAPKSRSSILVPGTDIFIFSNDS